MRSRCASSDEMDAARKLVAEYEEFNREYTKTEADIERLKARIASVEAERDRAVEQFETALDALQSDLDDREEYLETVAEDLQYADAALSALPDDIADQL